MEEYKLIANARNKFLVCQPKYNNFLNQLSIQFSYKAYISSSGNNQIFQRSILFIVILYMFYYKGLLIINVSADFPNNWNMLSNLKHNYDAQTSVFYTFVYFDQYKLCHRIILRVGVFSIVFIANLEFDIFSCVLR